MDSAILLIVPLIAGYMFATRWYGTRFKAARDQGHHLYFTAAFYGGLCLVVGSLLHLLLIALVPYWLGLLDFYLQALGLDDLPQDPWLPQGISICILTVLVGYRGADLLNWFGEHWRGHGFGWLNATYRGPSLNQYFLRAAIQASGSELVLMVLDSIEKQQPLLFTMQSGKVYVGYVLRTPDAREPADFRILPMLSGYRDQEQTVRFTTRYVLVYERMLANGLSTQDVLDLEAFSIVLPASEIRSCALFDADVYTHFAEIDTRG